MNIIWSLRLETLKAGDGKTFPKKGDELKMRYVGTLANGGKKFQVTPKCVRMWCKLDVASRELRHKRGNLKQD